jgi:hypothetical protein
MTKTKVYFFSTCIALVVGFLIPTNLLGSDPQEETGCPNNKCITVSGTCSHPLSPEAGLKCMDANGNPVSGTSASCVGTALCTQ